MRPISVGATGANVTTSGTSASTAIPNDSSGNKAKYCAISATAAVHVRWGAGAQTAVATDFMLNPNTQPVIIQTSNADNFAAIQDSTGGKVNIAPVEWQ